MTHLTISIIGSYLLFSAHTRIDPNVYVYDRIRSNIIIKRKKNKAERKLKEKLNLTSDQRFDRIYELYYGEKGHDENDVV